MVKMSSNDHITDADDFVVIDNVVDILLLNKELLLHMDELVDIEIAYGCPYSDRTILKKDRDEVVKAIDTLHEAYEFIGYKIPELKTTY